MNYRLPLLRLWILGFLAISFISGSSSTFAARALNDGPIVQIAQGQLQGFQVDLDDLDSAAALPIKSPKAPFKKADIFLGIPYAQPPVDDLRLEKPLPPNNWTGVLEAYELPASCVPLHLLASLDYSEDCLYLNVFRPSTEESKAKNESILSYPVLVFIHGGGFNLGGNFVERFQNLSNNFVSQGIVVVTVQYRLGLFGFFSDGKDIRGNLGLWDQRQALVWIQQNIQRFGGDPKRVTLWGQSAGSASVSMLSISRHTRDLFHQTIQQSGSWLSPWAFNDRVVNTSVFSAKALGCSAEESSALKACLKNITLEDVLYGISDIEMVRAEFEIVVYNPRFDNDFFDLPLEVLTKESPKKPGLTGFNSDEALFLTTDYPDSVFAFTSPLTVDHPESFTDKDLVKRMEEQLHAKKKDDEKTANSIKQDLAEFYLWNNTNEELRKPPFPMVQYTQLLSDALFTIPALWEARLKANNNWPIYVYQFDYVNRKMLNELPFRGVIHGAEYPFTVGVHIFGNYEFQEEEYRLRKSMLASFVNFVKTGNPSTKQLSWPLLTKNGPLRTLRVKQRPFVERRPKQVLEKLQFWDRLANKYDFDACRGLPTLKAR